MLNRIATPTKSALPSNHLWVGLDDGPTSEFIVGDCNDTSVIRRLKWIHGHPIAELERRMQPGAFSNAGFLGFGERLIDVLAFDNDYVLRNRWSHRRIAEQLLELQWAIRKADVRCDGGGLLVETKVFHFRGQRFEAKIQFWEETQDSPFLDGTCGSRDYFLTNRSTLQEIWWSDLLPPMIERYGFYEGRGSSFRLEPSRVLELFRSMR